MRAQSLYRIDWFPILQLCFCVRNFSPFFHSLSLPLPPSPLTSPPAKIYLTLNEFSNYHLRLSGNSSTDCAAWSTLLICSILTNRWRPPLKKILTLILQHQSHLHTPTWWRTVVLHPCLWTKGWSMSVQVWVLALSTKTCLHTHTTGTVSSVARSLNKPQHATLWVPWLCKVYCIYPPIVLLSRIVPLELLYTKSCKYFYMNFMQTIELRSWIIIH